MTIPADSAESVSDDDSERDAEEDNFSHNDLEMLGEQSDTTDVTGNTNSTGTASSSHQEGHSDYYYRDRLLNCVCMLNSM